MLAGTDEGETRAETVGVRRQNFAIRSGNFPIAPRVRRRPCACQLMTGALIQKTSAAHKLPTEVCEAAPLSRLLVPEIGISGIFADRPL